MTTVLAAILIAVSALLAVPRPSRRRVRALGETLLPGPQPNRRLFGLRGKGREPELALAYSLRALAAELHSGRTPNDALESAAGTPPMWPHALVAARLGESVATGLAKDASENPQLSGTLHQMAACWSVGVAYGSGLAASVERLALSAREQHEVTSTLRGELASSKATARMLAVLPLLGIAMGYLLGADPIGWFLSSPVGLGLLAVAMLLTGVGIQWTRRIVRRVDAVL